MSVDPYATLLDSKSLNAEPQPTARADNKVDGDRAEARTKAAALIKVAEPARADHPYLIRKQVKPSANLREISPPLLRETLGYQPKSGHEHLTGRVLVVPVMDGQELSTCEMIDETGRKSAIRGGRKKGYFWQSIELPESNGVASTILIAEGVASALSAYEATGLPAIAVLSCVGFKPVLSKLRSRYPSGTLVVLADKGNGQQKAEKAARSTRAALAIPTFPEGSKGSDFNDVACITGPDAVRAQINSAIAQFTQTESDSENITVTGVTGVTGVTSSKHDGSHVTVEASDGVTSVPTGASGVEKLSVPETERPCYRVLERSSHIRQAGRVLPPGVWHFGYKPETERKPANFTHTWVCSPLMVLAITHDQQDANYGRLLRFRNPRNVWREWAMPMDLLRGSGDELRGELLAMGVEISPDDRPALARYIQEQHPKKRVNCTLRVGWCNGNFVLPDTVIGCESESVIYQTGQRSSDEYTIAGDLTEWRESVAKLAGSNPMLMLGLSVAFAGPLLKKCNAESGGIHFVGDSSTGKTTIIHAACSVWGGENYRRSWRSTANGLEGAAQLFNDNLLALDEISECDPREVGAIVYSLGNGRGKQRATRHGNARSVAQWRCAVLSSGERSMDTSIRESGRPAKAGQSIRLLDVPVARTHGAWDCLHDFVSGSAMSDALKGSAINNHGRAGREFLERLTRDERDFCQLLDDLKNVSLFSAGRMTGQEKRASARFAMFALAGELATEYGITGWIEGAATKAAAEAFRLWLANRGRGNNETRQICDQVRDFIERHGDSRFSDIDNKSESAVRDRAGWWEDSTDGRLYLFHPSGMRDALDGHDFKRSLNVLQSIGALAAPDKGERARSRRVNGRNTKLYYIKPGALEAVS